MVDSGCGGRGQVTGLVYFAFDTLFVLREYREMSVCLKNFLFFLFFFFVFFSVNSNILRRRSIYCSIFFVKRNSLLEEL